MIVFDSVTKRYGTHTALSEVSFTIEPGEFVFILGPSGAGKTTLARMMIKEMEPTEGTIKVGEFDLKKIRGRELPVLRQQIGVVFQDYKLLPDRTAAENIALSLEIIGKTDAVIHRTVDELLKVVGLEGKGNLFPSQLSGGETQRVVIARALATDPAVLFADEPTGNLDRDNALQIVDLLDRINKHGTTVVMATHDMDLVKKMNRRNIILEEGKVVKDTGRKHPPKEEFEEKKETGDEQDTEEHI